MEFFAKKMISEKIKQNSNEVISRILFYKNLYFREKWGRTKKTYCCFLLDLDN